MAITIKELLASDTLSEAADKINFNFDQLLLNGGGPAGPIGPEGPIGPIGGRGIRGSQWFEDPSSDPGTDPNTLTFVDLEEGDNYLQANGVVWEYNGTVWVATSIDLTGPQGDAGDSGFLRFGNPLNGQQSIYPQPMPDGILGGATGANEAVPTMVIGGFVSITPTTPGITYSESLIGDSMAQTIDSTNTSLFIHQLNDSASSIRFMGGNSSQNYEQDNIDNLATIKLIEDDRLKVDVPKAPLDSSSLIKLSGFIIDTFETGQFYQSGKHIKFITGQSTANSGSTFEQSDFTVEVNKSAGSNSNPKINLKVTDLGGIPSAQILIGDDISTPNTTTKDGNIVLDGGNIRLVTLENIRLSSGNSIFLSSAGAVSCVASNAILLVSQTSNIIIGADIDINLTAQDDINLTAQDNVDISADNDVNITAQDDVNINAVDDVNINATTNGNINLTTPNKIILEADDNIELNSNNNNILITASQNINLEADNAVNITVTTNGNINLTTPDKIILDTGDHIELRSDADINLEAGNDVNITAENDVYITAQNDGIEMYGNVRMVNNTEGDSGLYQFGIIPILTTGTPVTNDYNIPAVDYDRVLYLVSQRTFGNTKIRSGSFQIRGQVASTDIFYTVRDNEDDLVGIRKTGMIVNASWIIPAGLECDITVIMSADLIIEDGPNGNLHFIYIKTHKLGR